jgi:hypothetical protein
MFDACTSIDLDLKNALIGDGEGPKIPNAVKAQKKFHSQKPLFKLPAQSCST